MKCYACLNEIRDGARFCHHCGADQSNKPAPVVEEVPVYAAPVEEPVYTAPVEEAAPVAEEAPVYTAPAEEPVPVYTAPQPAPEYNPYAGYNAAPQQPVYAPVYCAQPSRPVIQLPTHRGLGKMFWLSILTLGIYPMVVYSRMVEELNMVASRHDGERTQQYIFAGMLSGLTLGIYAFVWIHNMCRRMGNELTRRNLGYKFGASTFWLWNVLGSLILVGPFIFTHKFCKAMNKLNADFNDRG